METVHVLMAPPTKKRRITGSSQNLKILNGTEKSDATLIFSDDLSEKELWFFQLPKDVSLTTVTTVIQAPL